MFSVNWSEDEPSSESLSLNQDATSSGLSKDSIFDLLRIERRRVLLHHLRVNDGAAPLYILAEAVASDETDGTVSQSLCKRVSVDLHHAHLPKLESAGVIEYDRRNRMVRLQEGHELLFEFLYFDGEA